MSTPKDTEAPTNEGTLAALRSSMTADEEFFASVVLQHYGLFNRVLSQEEAVEIHYYTEEEYQALFFNKNVQRKLREEGMKPSELEPVPDPTVVDPNLYRKAMQRKSGLSPDQLRCANIMLDLVDTRSQKKKLQDLGISTRTYNTWLKDPMFKAYLQDRAEAMLKENQHEAHLALIDKVRMGDVGAIKYFNSLTGRFEENLRPVGAVDSPTANFQQLLVQILEIIADEINDHNTAIRIADKFQKLIGAHDMAANLMKTVVEKPKVVKNREISL